MKKMILRAAILVSGGCACGTAGAVSSGSMEVDSLAVVLDQVDVVANRATAKNAGRVHQYWQTGADGQ